MKGIILKWLPASRYRALENTPSLCSADETSTICHIPVIANRLARVKTRWPGVVCVRTPDFGY